MIYVQVVGKINGWKLYYLDCAVAEHGFFFLYYIIFQHENEENCPTGNFIKRMQRTYFPRVSRQTVFEWFVSPGKKSILIRSPCIRRQFSGDVIHSFIFYRQTSVWSGELQFSCILPYFPSSTSTRRLHYSPV